MRNLDEYMKTLEKNHNFYGSVLVAKGGKILLDDAYGYTDLQQNIKNKPQTRFAIGSVTKQFVATSIMQLNEKGLVDLQDSISKYIPEVAHGDKITIHNLLSHTSGLMNFTESPDFFTINSNKAMDMVKIINDSPLMFNPGEDFHYSNTNYLLLGILVEKLSGMSYDDYLYENIFKPLNMMDTGISYKDNNTYDATAYSGHIEVAPIDDELLLGKAHGAGSMYSTVEDLYRWDRALDRGDLLKEETIEKIFAEHTDAPGIGSYGYGWMIANSEIGKKVFHGGNTLGFTASINRYIDEDITIIILSNKGYYDINSLSDELTSIVLDKDYELPKALESMVIEDGSIYDKYIGVYKFIQGTYLEISKLDNKLYAQATGQEAFEIFPETEEKFFAKIVDVRIEFLVNENEEVAELNFQQSGVTFSCPRADIEEKEPIDIDSKIYDDYLGQYQLGENLIFTISREGDRLFAQLTGQEAFEIFPTSETEFFYKVIDAQISFVRDEKGNVEGLILHQLGRDMPAKKIH